MTETVPFTPLEEAIFYIERKHGPWNVQFEVETTARIDADRLQAAVITACNTHPLARAHQQPHSGMDVRCRWKIPDAIEQLPADTLTVTDGLTSTDRSRFYYEPFDPTEELPFRLLVDRGDGQSGGDRVLICANHVAVDGVGGARFARSLCRAYRGEDLADPVALTTARDAVDDASSAGPTIGLGLLGDALDYIANAVESPTRVAGDGGVDTAGWLFEQRRLGDGLTAQMMQERPEGSSVNDTMLAALHRCVDTWNRNHGEMARKISVMMPLNLRPRKWFYDVVGMFTAFDSITTRQRDRQDPRTTLQTVVDQTRRIKDRDRATVPHEALKLVPPGTPVGLKQRFPELLNGPGRRLVDTAVLSNLGRIPDPLPGFAPDDDPSLWFSPPSITPSPVGIGVGTVDGTVHVTGRYHRNRFDTDAAAAFTDRYLDCLENVVS